MRIKKESFNSLEIMFNDFLENCIEIARREEMYVDIMTILDSINIAKENGESYIEPTKHQLDIIEFVLEEQKIYNIFNAICEINHLFDN